MVCHLRGGEAEDCGETEVAGRLGMLWMLGMLRMLGIALPAVGGGAAKDSKDI